MGQAWGYAIPVFDQASGQYGLAGQEEAIKTYFAEKLAPRGVEWGDMVVDSAEARRRHRFLARSAGILITRVAGDGDHVIIGTLSHAFRSLKDIAETIKRFHRLHVFLHVVDWGFDLSNPQDFDGFTYALATMLRLEEERREAKAKRAKDFSEERRRQGYFLGSRAPPGFKLDGPPRKRRLVKDDEAREHMALIAQQVAAKTPFSQIAQRLNEAGVRWKQPVPKRERRPDGPAFDLAEWDAGRVKRFYEAWLRICRDEGLELLTGKL
ncbi:MAG TPA: recombinase family protein, partial [Pirellulales bacterium]|nr:recombinase family protein [Pirellulales bacterium]